MGRKMCENCGVAHATLKRPRNGSLLCNPCFFRLFEDETHQTIIQDKLFQPGDVVACGASGGKDSTVLMHLMKLLNDRYNYGLKLVLLSIDEGIKGYRDDSLKTVHRNSSFYDLPLTILSYKELYGWSMDEIVQAIGSKSNCTFCGVFRRQALDRGAAKLGATKIVTGHNCDDTAETVLMNVLRADIPRLSRCTMAATGNLAAANASVAAATKAQQEGNSGTGAEFSSPAAVGEAVVAGKGGEDHVVRVKPLKYAYEKEIVLYAHFKKLDYFTTECTYSKEAFRGNARVLLKDLESIRSSAIADTVFSGEHLLLKEAAAVPNNTQRSCERCGYISSQALCRACVLMDSLNRGAPKVALNQ